MLLALTFKNYGSFMEEATLDCQLSNFRRNVPEDGNWPSATERVIALYGANASGKSTVLNILALLAIAVANSRHDDSFLKKLRNPHRLNKEQPTEFEVEYVSNGYRFRWSLSLDDDGIFRETLKSTKTGYWRLVFDRCRDELRFGAGSGIPRAAQENIRQYIINSWVLTMTAWSGIKTRGEYYTAVEWWLFNMRVDCDSHRDAALDDSFFQLIQNPLWVSAVHEVLRVADVDVSSVSVDERSIPYFPELVGTIAKLRKLRDLLNQSSTTESSDITEFVDREGAVEFSQDEREMVLQSLVFTHGANNRTFDLKQEDESAGTRIWFRLSISVVYAIVCGSVLVVDEIDSGLHPRLVNYLVSLFTNQNVNTSGAQLIFTAHNTALLNDLTDANQESERAHGIWLVEKNSSISELTAMDEYAIRPTHNVEKRYLQGAFGAVPVVDQRLGDTIQHLRYEHPRPLEQSS